jgi:hypothetical protein
MSVIGYGYGSEWQLLRFLGYHREHFDDVVKQATGVQRIQWLDFPFDPQRQFNDAEWKGLDFLPLPHSARANWPEFWPQRGNAQNWDAVARIRTNDDADGWLLVEAKAHLGELKSSCGAKAQGGLEQIKAAMDQTKSALNVNPESDWLTPYYQMANRLAVLTYLRRHGINAHLLNIYFMGDRNPAGTCPTCEAEWATELAAMCEHLGIAGRKLEGVHQVLLPVCPNGNDLKGKV